MNKDISDYNKAQDKIWKPICVALAKEIHENLPKAESKVWHGAPVWFIEGNPVAGYSVRKNCVQLLFWSGQSFEEPKLEAEGSFKAAQFKYTDKEQINSRDLKRWLKKAKSIQWDHKNIVKRKGKLLKLDTTKSKA